MLGSVRLVRWSVLYVLLWLVYLTLIRLLLTYLLTSYGDNKIKIFWGTYPTGYNQHNTPNKSYGFFANFMNESTKFQVPRSLALTPPPHSSHDYLPNLTLSVGMDLDS